MSPLPAVAICFILSFSFRTNCFVSATVQDYVHTRPSTVDGMSEDSNILHDSLSESMQRSLRTIENAQRLPSCQKVATAALLHSCSTLEGTAGTENDEPKGADVFVDETMKLYAVRLAVCEVDGAGSPVPEPCQAFLPTIATTKKASWAGYLTGNRASEPRRLYPEYDAITEQHFEQCVSALHDRPQTWTSYSNSRQNANIICHSMRGEIERDQHINLHRVLSKTTEEVVNALFSSKEEFAKFQAGFSDLAAMLQQAHLDLGRSYDGMMESAQNFWAQWEVELREGARDITTDLQRARSEVDQIMEELRNGRIESKDAATRLQVQLKEVALQHSAGASHAADGLVALEDLIGYITETTLQEMGQKIYQISGDIDVMNNAMAIGQQRIQNLDTAILSADAKISNFSERLEHVCASLQSAEAAANHVERLNNGLDTLFGVFGFRVTWIAYLAAGFVGLCVMRFAYETLRWLPDFLVWPFGMMTWPFSKTPAASRNEEELSRASWSGHHSLPINNPRSKYFAKRCAV